MSHFSQSCRHLSTSTHQVAARQVRGVSPHYRPTLEANDHFLEGVPRHDTLSSLHSSSYASQKQVKSELLKKSGLHNRVQYLSDSRTKSLLDTSVIPRIISSINFDPSSSLKKLFASGLTNSDAQNDTNSRNVSCEKSEQNITLSHSTSISGSQHKNNISDKNEQYNSAESDAEAVTTAYKAARTSSTSQPSADPMALQGRQWPYEQTLKFVGLNSSRSKERHQLPFTKKTESNSSVSSTSIVNATAATVAKSSLDSAVSWLQRTKSLLPGTSAKETTPANKVEKKKTVIRPEQVARISIDRRTRGLVLGLRNASSNVSRYTRLEELCKHIIQYPDAKYLATKEKVVGILLRLHTSSDDATRDLAREALALVGHVEPVAHRGIRILSLDGGGTKGLLSIEMMKALEEASGQPIYSLFDFVCGVSTGSLIGIMATVFRVPLDICESVYKRFSREMFERNRLMGTSKLVINYAYYDAALWEKILRENIGERSFLETTRDPMCPKVAVISCLLNQHKIEPFIFRNYSLPTGVHSHYPGSFKYRLWEAIRASSAAPGYYQEKVLDGNLHQDGGVLANNPTAIAVHESRLLWPKTPIQCVVSVGTGQYESLEEVNDKTTFSSLKTKLNKIVQSATDTEGVHILLQDLLQPETYFRFNPYMSEDFLLDEIQPDSWARMQHDTQMYCRKNQYKLKKATEVLQYQKRPHQKAKEWLDGRVKMAG